MKSAHLPTRVDDSTAISPERAIPPPEITELLDRYRHVDPEEAMIPVFQEMQTKYGYITQAAADQVCVELDLPEANVYGVLTFYSFFRYTPRAGHVIMSCEGTGCYVRGAAAVRGAIENRLDVGPGDTSADGHWTFEPQSICLGACDLAPLVEIEGRYYAHVTPEKMDQIITDWEGAEDNPPVGDNYVQAAWLTCTKTTTVSVPWPKNYMPGTRWNDLCQRNGERPPGYNGSARPIRRHT